MKVELHKRKVKELGELPTLDRSVATRNVLFSVLACGTLLHTTLPLGDDKCEPIGSLCLRTWCHFLFVAIGTYFFFQLMAMVCVCTCVPMYSFSPYTLVVGRWSQSDIPHHVLDNFRYSCK